VLLVASVLMLWALFRWQRKQSTGVMP